METQKTYLIVFLELLSFAIVSGVFIFTPLVLLDNYGLLVVVLISLLLFVIKIFLTIVFTICVLKSGKGLHYNAILNIRNSLYFLGLLLIFDIVLSSFLSYAILFISTFLSYLPVFCISLIYKMFSKS